MPAPNRTRAIMPQLTDGAVRELAQLKSEEIAATKATRDAWSRVQSVAATDREGADYDSALAEHKTASDAMFAAHNRYFELRLRRIQQAWKAGYFKSGRFRYADYDGACKAIGAAVMNILSDNGAGIAGAATERDAPDC